MVHEHQLHRRLRGDDRPSGRISPAHHHRRARTDDGNPLLREHEPRRHGLRDESWCLVRLHEVHLHPGRQAEDDHRTGRRRMVVRLRPLRPPDRRQGPRQGSDARRVRRLGPRHQDHGRARQVDHRGLRRVEPGHRHLDRCTDGRQPTHRLQLRHSTEGPAHLRHSLCGRQDRRRVHTDRHRIRQFGPGHRDSTRTARQRPVREGGRGGRAEVRGLLQPRRHLAEQQRACDGWFGVGDDRLHLQRPGRPGHHRRCARRLLLRALSAAAADAGRRRERQQERLCHQSLRGRHRSPGSQPCHGPDPRLHAPGPQLQLRPDRQRHLDQ